MPGKRCVALFSFGNSLVSLCSAQPMEVVPSIPGKTTCAVGQNRHESCCICNPFWGQCRFSDEDPFKGCGNKDITCSEDCPGDYPWKELYGESRSKEREILGRLNEGDPTSTWPRAKNNTDGRFAVVFAGGMHSFTSCYHSWTTNVVEASGGKVDFYFHVWGDELSHVNSTRSRTARHLAQSHPNTKAYVEEEFSKHFKLLDRDEPKLMGSSMSWIGEIEKNYDTPKLRPQGRPFRVGAGYSQWRKIYMGHELVRSSGVEYQLIVKARPDVMVLEPLDLRALLAHFQGRPSTSKAKGHFMVMPERTFQVVVDHFAIGTPEAMYEYAAKPLPYTEACCEGYVWRNLVMRGFARTDEVIAEDFSDVSLVRKEAQKNEGNGGGDRENWAVVPEAARGNPYSPILLHSNALHTTGEKVCLRPVGFPGGGGVQACVPLYRTRFAYVFKVCIY